MLSGQQSTSNAPPSYEEIANVKDDQKVPLLAPEHQLTQPGLHPTPDGFAPTAAPLQVTNAGGVTVYHYVHPLTQERVDSLLPPHHPEMICLQQGHIPHNRFGWLGIIAAVFWFPLGLGCLLVDRQVKCERCAKVLEEGACK